MDKTKRIIQTIESITGKSVALVHGEAKGYAVKFSEPDSMTNADGWRVLDYAHINDVAGFGTINSDLLEYEMCVPEFNRKQVLALFARLTGCGCFQRPRDYNIAKLLMLSHLGIDYESFQHEEYQETYDKAVRKGVFLNTFNSLKP